MRSNRFPRGRWTENRPAVPTALCLPTFVFFPPGAARSGSENALAIDHEGGRCGITAGKSALLKLVCHQAAEIVDAGHAFNPVAVFHGIDPNHNDDKTPVDIVFLVRLDIANFVSAKLAITGIKVNKNDFPAHLRKIESFAREPRSLQGRGGRADFRYRSRSGVQDNATNKNQQGFFQHSDHRLSHFRIVSRTLQNTLQRMQTGRGEKTNADAMEASYTIPADRSGRQHTCAW